MVAHDTGGASEARIIQAGLELLFFARWRQPIYCGPGSEPGWHCFSAVNRHGERELVEVEFHVDRVQVRAAASVSAGWPISLAAAGTSHTPATAPSQTPQTV